MKFTKFFLNISMKLITCVFLINITNIIYTKIPDYIGLYTLFFNEKDKTVENCAIDTIGIGQALKYSNWIENVYTYAPEDNNSRKVISKLWFKRLINDDGKFYEDDNFLISKKHPASTFLKAKDFGILIKYIREFNRYQKDGSQKDINLLDKDRENLKLTNHGKKDKEKLKEFVKNLEELKYSKNFIPEMAEAILWAYFDSKEDWGEKEFKECLDNINTEYWKKLQDTKYKENFYTIDEDTDKSIIENIAKKLIAKPDVTKDLYIHYDSLTRYIIKSAKIKKIPTKVLQTDLKYKDPKTGYETEEKFPTCFESAILDLISVLIYNRDSINYDPNILPESVRSDENFKNLVSQVFKTLPEGKKDPKDMILISQSDINKKAHIQAWINLVTNLDDLDYKNNTNIHYDLVPSLENLIKVLNKFFNFDLKIKDIDNILEITSNNNDKLIIEKNKKESWQKLFDVISKKLSDKNRTTKFSITENSNFTTKENKNITTGTIEISIGKTELKIIIEYGHAHIDCIERDKSQLSAKDLKIIKNLITEKLTRDIDKNKNLIPLFIFLPYIDIVYQSPKVEELFYYSFELKDNNTKLNLLDKIFESKIPVIKKLHENESIRELISKLIKILSDNNDFKYSLFSFLINCDEKDKEDCWQNYVENKIKNELLPEIYQAYKQEDKTQLINFLYNIFSNTLVFTKFLKNILSTILENPNIKDNLGYTPLMISVQHGSANYDIAKMILDNPKTDLNAKDKYGQSAMSIVSSCNCGGDEELAALFIKNPKIDLLSKQEKLYEMAYRDNKSKIVKMLLEVPGIDVNYMEELPTIQPTPSSLPANTYQREPFTETPLHRAIIESQNKILKILLANPKTDPNIKNKYGKSPLIEALTKYTDTDGKPVEHPTIEERTESVRLLLNHPKIDINIKSAYDKTPKEIAKENGFNGIVKLFEIKEKEDKIALAINNLLGENPRPENFVEKLNKLKKELTKLFEIKEKRDKIILAINNLLGIEPRPEDFVKKFKKLKKELENIDLELEQK